MARLSRPVHWIKPALKDFLAFPLSAQERLKFALGLAAEGAKADIAKPLRGLGSGVFEIALAFGGNAFRVVYILQVDDAVWVIHAFQKKSTQGIRTPRHEMRLVADRIRALRRMTQGN